VSLVYRDVTTSSPPPPTSPRRPPRQQLNRLPGDEYQSFRFGFALQRSELLTSTNDGSAQQAIDWASVRQNGKALRAHRSQQRLRFRAALRGNRFNSYELTAG
jgi:hypothetical protein